LRRRSYEVECKINDASSPFAPVKTVTGAKYTVTRVNAGHRLRLSRAGVALSARDRGAIRTFAASPKPRLDTVMTFDPTKPADASVTTVAELRSQFTALKALIDAQPVVAYGRVTSDWTQQFQQLQRCHRPLLACGGGRELDGRDCPITPFSSASGQGIKFRVAGPGAGPAYVPRILEVAGNLESFDEADRGERFVEVDAATAATADRVRSNRLTDPDHSAVPREIGTITGSVEGRANSRAATTLPIRPAAGNHPRWGQEPHK
jgi:hypothetical protein